ncbi:LLM class flavin-dependent oxidoreductase [Streptomyces sp. RKAG290]|uniref:LLM class flavin-dependent oxidoreductase n=1 Tax=Streptomyces sp. RKAG290 TaxID=2888348 RepID=UPI0035A98222
MDESLELLRAALSGEVVDFAGEYLTVASARIGPLPATPLDMRLAGSAPAGLRRAGRYGGGWLGVLPDAGSGRAGPRGDFGPPADAAAEARAPALRIAAPSDAP